MEQLNVPAEEVEEKRKELAEDKEEGGAREGGPWQEIRCFTLLVHLTLTMRRERMKSFKSADKVHLRKLLTDYKDVLLTR